MTKQCVLFDLDGTLADTGPDLHFSLNQALIENGLQPVSYETIRPAVSHGGQAMLKAALDIEPEDSGYDQLKRLFLNNYLENITVHTKLFDGVEQLLSRLEERAIPWGVVTNKPAWLTDPLMLGLQLTRRASCIISGDTTEHAKPHPLPVLHACHLAGAEPAESIYVGDAARDIEAGNRAGCKTLVALFGYLTHDDQPDTWGADGAIEHPMEILQWLR